MERAEIRKPVQVPLCGPAQTQCSLWASFLHWSSVHLDSGLFRCSCSLSLSGLQFGQQDGRKSCLCGWPGLGCVSSVSAEARSVESCEIAPEEDIDGQQEDSIDVADTSPEWLLLNAGQLLLQCSLLCWAQGLLHTPREPTEPAPEELSPGPAWG